MVAIILGVVVIALIGAIAVVAAGYGEGLAPAESDSAPLPEGELDADALRSVRFSTSLRGYRMDEVDALLARLSAQLDARSEPSGQ